MPEVITGGLLHDRMQLPSFGRLLTPRMDLPIWSPLAFISQCGSAWDLSSCRLMSWQRHKRSDSLPLRSMQLLFALLRI
jgi:hypothetical protein